MNQQQINNLEQIWRANQKRPTKRELLDIFPEAIPYLEEEQRESIGWINVFETIITYQLEEINKVYQGFSQWFQTEVLRIQDGAILEKHEKRLKELNGFLNPWPAKEGDITDEDIHRAKEYPFDQLIQVNRAGFGKCPFHEEQKASFYIRKNFGYCFGCAWGGDTIKFIQDTENIGFIQAVKRLI